MNSVNFNVVYIYICARQNFPNLVVGKGKVWISRFEEIFLSFDFDLLNLFLAPTIYIYKRKFQIRSAENTRNFVSYGIHIGRNGSLFQFYRREDEFI